MKVTIKVTELELSRMKREMSQIGWSFDRTFWGKYFDYYNENHDIKLHMSCRPCYSKVYQYIRNNFEQTTI